MPPTRPARRAHARRAGALLAALVATGLATGCSGDEEQSAAEREAAKIADGVTIEQLQTWPLTGERVGGDGTAAKKRPVLVVKIDNSSSSAPQVGLSKADLVVEELVEGGTTRLAAFFYEQVPDVVGPVRSMRASDIGIVSPADADIVTSGAAPVTIARINDAGIRFFNEGSPGFYRDGARSAPYDLFTDLSRTAEETVGELARPDDYLPWGTEEDLPQGKPASGLSAGFGTHTTTWSYDKAANGGDGGYVNVNSYAGADDRFPTESVLVLRVEVGDAGYRDPAGSFVPETKFEGTGSATLFHGGRRIEGAWSKPQLTSPLTLTTGRGDRRRDLQVPTGHTWIELVPRDTGSLTVTP